MYPKYYNAETSFKIDGEGSLPKMVYIKPLLQLVSQSLLQKSNLRNMILRFLSSFYLQFYALKDTCTCTCEVDFGLLSLNFTRISWNFVVCHFKGGGAKDDPAYCDSAAKARATIGFSSCQSAVPSV